MVTASDRAVVNFSLTGGECHDAPAILSLLSNTIKLPEHKFILMDKAYCGSNVREKAILKGFIPVVPPKMNCKNPWEYDKEKYKQRNQIERYFLRLKRFRRIFTRFDKLDIVFTGFICLVMIVDSVCANRL